MLALTEPVPITSFRSQHCSTLPRKKTQNKLHTLFLNLINEPLRFLTGLVTFVCISALQCVLSVMDADGKPLQTEIMCLYTEQLNPNPSPLYPYYVQGK